jgi:two-component system cell cycle response regulator DivK
MKARFDIELPAMDGHAVASALKSDPHLRSVPIVALTSYAKVGDPEKCLAAGASGYIGKPIDPGSFVDEAARFLLPPTAESR